MIMLVTMCQQPCDHLVLACIARLDSSLTSRSCDYLVFASNATHPALEAFVYKGDDSHKAASWKKTQYDDGRVS